MCGGLVVGEKEPYVVYPGPQLATPSIFPLLNLVD